MDRVEAPEEFMLEPVLDVELQIQPLRQYERTDDRRNNAKVKMNWVNAGRSGARRHEHLDNCRAGGGGNQEYDTLEAAAKWNSGLWEGYLKWQEQGDSDHLVRNRAHKHMQEIVYHATRP